MVAEKPKNKVGRPKGKTGNREQIIEAARTLFMAQQYESVSVRQIATEANVNVGLISYYFGNKETLFFTMLRETIIPVYHKMWESLSETNGCFREVMRTYYSEMIHHPEFPQLVIQVLNLKESHSQKELLEDLFTDIKKPIQEAILKKMNEDGVLRDGVDPMMSQVTLFMLITTPFIMPQVFMQMNGIEFNAEYLERLLDHNMSMLQHGLLK